MTTVNERHTALRRSVDRLYAVFADYSTTSQLVEDAALCRYDAEGLLRYSLEEIPASAMDSYSMRALTTWGSVDDLKHFLPRLLELTISPERTAGMVPLLDPPVVFSKLAYGEWSSWRAREREAVSVFLHALWALVISLPLDAVATHTCFDEVDDCMAAIQEATVEIAPFLDRWMQDAKSRDVGYNATVHMAHTALSYSYWLSMQGTTRRGEVFDRWLQTGDLADCLQKAFWDHPEARYSQTLSDAEAFVRARVRARDR